MGYAVAQQWDKSGRNARSGLNLLACRAAGNSRRRL